ncbi:carboxymuconolactone decarboxylase family protein [Cytobacillus purgationiresistens]|uniref:carboxymuconolactone decarboxylase family protein n=1 Tax=Cytobacillus purgationiresistens TaxID=863449 RepID=UPI0027D81D55|nr:carboxymuconolactone decarboxylase family protein [Cytobacillus purgationiresistens]
MKGLNEFDLMKKYASHVHEAVATMNEAIFADGSLSKKEKHLILIGVNAGRRYEDSMLFHTKEALISGASAEEIADVLSTCIISRGIPAWLSGIEAIKLAVNEGSNDTVVLNTEKGKEFQSVEECITYYENEFDTLPDWVALLKQFNPDVLYKYSNLRNAILTDHCVSRKLKELTLTAINICDQYEKGINIHLKNARNLGATEDEIAEVSLLCMFASGISGWRTGSAYLEK